MDREALLEELKKYEWYHTIHLQDDISTPGIPTIVPIQNDVMKAINTISMQGKRVLDIGFRDGFFSFECEKMGASEIVAFDNCLMPTATQFLKPFFQSKVRMEELNLFDLKRDTFGGFDVVIFCGVLYHLRYPFWSLKLLRDVMNDGGYLVTETAVLRQSEEHAVMLCPAPEESPYDPTSVTFFNPKALKDTLRSLGFTTEYTQFKETGQPIDRVVMVSKYNAADMDPKLLQYWEGTHTSNITNDWDNWG